MLNRLAVDSSLLVNTNFNVIVSCPVDKVTPVTSYLETKLYECGIMPSRAAYNQLELFVDSFPGNAYAFNPDYDLFLTLSDAALCFFFKEHLKEYYKLPIDVLCKHEFVFDGLREEYGGDHHDPGHVTTLDVAKRLLDYGYHAPTIYFPLLFHEAMMIEPTETESKKTLDEFIDVMKKIAIEARDQRELLKTAPHHTPVRRLDDVKAVKEPKFTYKML